MIIAPTITQSERVIATYHFLSSMQNSAQPAINTPIPAKKHIPPYQTSKMLFICGKILYNIPKISSGKHNAPHKTIPAASWWRFCTRAFPAKHAASVRTKLIIPEYIIKSLHFPIGWYCKILYRQCNIAPARWISICNLLLFAGKAQKNRRYRTHCSYLRFSISASQRDTLSGISYRLTRALPLQMLHTCSSSAGWP